MSFHSNDERDKLTLARFLKTAHYVVSSAPASLGDALLSRLDLNTSLRKDAYQLDQQRIENFALILLIEMMREHRDEIIEAILSSPQKAI